MNRVLIKLYIPQLEKQYDVWIPINKKVYTVINAIIKGLEGLTKMDINFSNTPNLYNKETADIYDPNQRVVDTDIKNGSEIILF